MSGSVLVHARTRPGIVLGAWTGAYRVGIPGEYYPATACCSRRSPMRNCPVGAACCTGQGVLGAGRTGDGGGDGPCTHPCGARSVSPWEPSLVQDPQNAASWPIGTRFQVISRNIVKTGKCHREVCKRPVIVPISKTSSKSHLLIFPGFTFRQPSLTRN